MELILTLAIMVVIALSSGVASGEVAEAGKETVTLETPNSTEDSVRQAARKVLAPEFEAEAAKQAQRNADGTFKGKEPEVPKAETPAKDTAEMVVKPSGETPEPQAADDKQNEGVQPPDEASMPKLDEELAKIPGAKERWEQMEAGVQKLVGNLKDAAEAATTEAKALTEILGDEQALARVARINEWGKLFEDKGQTHFYVHELVKALEEEHKVPAGTYLKPPGERPLPDGVKASLERAMQEEFGVTDPTLSDGWKEAGYDSSGEYKGAMDGFYRSERRRLLAEWNREQTPKLSPAPKGKEPPADKPPAAAAKPAADTSKQEGADILGKDADKIVKAVNDELTTTDNGWTLTRKQIEEAVSALPHLASEPAKACRKYFSDELLAYTREALTKKPPEVDKGAPGSSNQPGHVDVPPAGKRSARDLAKLDPQFAKSVGL